MDNGCINFDHVHNAWIERVFVLKDIEAYGIVNCIFLSINGVFWQEFHWIFFPRTQLTIREHFWYNGLALNRRLAIIWINDGLVYWRINASVDLQAVVGISPLYWNSVLVVHLVYHSALKMYVINNVVRYCINNYSNWVRISIKCWFHKRHPIPRPNGRAMGCLLRIFVRKLTA